jgi:hypothetical protein
MKEFEIGPEATAAVAGRRARLARTNTGKGRKGALTTAPACATEQIEHSWVASLELAG